MLSRPKSVEAEDLTRTVGVWSHSYRLLTAFGRKAEETLIVIKRPHRSGMALIFPRWMSVIACERQKAASRLTAPMRSLIQPDANLSYWRTVAITLSVWWDLIPNPGASNIIARKTSKAGYAHIS
jgi:hypothetical protein